MRARSGCPARAAADPRAVACGPAVVPSTRPPPLPRAPRFRLPWLPAADALVVESGGRVFYPLPGLPTMAPLVEDVAWREVQAAAAGPAGQDAVPPEQRSGPLWRLYADVAEGRVPGLAGGVRLDAHSYTTAFRLHLAGAEQASALAAALPPGLATAMNLGHTDVFPATSGKVRCAGWGAGRGVQATWAGHVV